VTRLAVLAAGGTGGHMFPAQSLAEELLRRGWRVALATDTRGFTYSDGFAPSVERRALKAGTPARGGLIGKIAAPLALLSGTLEAVQWFKRDRPAIVIGFGGYPAAPATAAAIRMKIPRIIHEQNAVLGKANRLFVKRATLLACGIGIPDNTPPGIPTEVVGNPIRDTALAQAGKPYPQLDGRIRLVAFGGSQGSKALSDAVPQALAALPLPLRDRLSVTLQVRDEGLAQATRILAEASIKAEAAAFFGDMPERLARAHLVIARAGASTCAELTALGRPSILVPLPSAMADHQTANARILAEAGMASAAKTLGKPDAASDLADLVEKHADAASA